MAVLYDPPTPPFPSILIVLIDSGVDAARFDPLRLLAGRNFTAEGAADDVHDALGHGTAVAGTLLRALPSARLLPIRLLDRRGVLRDPDRIEAAFDWIVERADDLQIGLVCAAFADVSVHVCDDRFRGSPLQQQVAALRDRGIPTVCAAGNGFGAPRAPVEQGMGWPAILRDVVSVGAVQRRPEGFRLSPRTRRLHPELGNGCSTTVFTEPDEPDGTSGATAVIAGRLAMLRANDREATVDALVQRLLRDATTGQDEDGLAWPVIIRATGFRVKDEPGRIWSQGESG